MVLVNKKIWLHIIISQSRIIFDQYILAGLRKRLSALSEPGRLYVDSVNGTTDHIHVLAAIGPDLSPGQVVDQIKEESADWINHNIQMPAPFIWLEEYSVFSVSLTQLQKIRKFIADQRLQHHHRSLQEEIDSLQEIISQRKKGKSENS